MTAIYDTGIQQQISANLACALRLPFEQILIKNITKRIAAGVFLIPFDPALLSLNSNGTVICFAAGGGTARSVLLRRLQDGEAVVKSMLRRLQETGPAIDVNYIIVDPPLSLLTMNTEEFAGTVAADAAVQALVTTLEGSGVAVEAPPELASAAAAAPSAAATVVPVSSSPSIGVIAAVVVGTVLGAALVSGLVATGLFFLLNPRPAAVAAPTGSKSPAVVYVQETNTLNPMALAPAGAAPATRATFVPQAARSGGTRV